MSNWSDEPAAVRLEKLRLSLESTAEQGVATLAATARSSNVKDLLDCRTAVATRGGEIVSVGRPGTSHMGTCLAGVLKHYGENVHPGDIFVNNDPFEGGSHLPCMWLGRPVFVGSELVAWALASAHLVDVGGMVPGSMTASASEIYQEGLRIPPLRLYEKDEPNQTLLTLISANVRGPEVVLGDITAEVAALRTMEREIQSTARRFGTAQEFRTGLETLLDRAEAQVRAAIRKLPDGTAEWTERVDHGIANSKEPLLIKVKITKSGELFAIDYSGTSAQVSASINSTWSYTRNISAECLRLVVGEELPQNEGVVRPVQITAPAGTLVNPVMPAAVGARAIVALRMVSAILGALSQLVPEKLSACMVGLEGAVTFSGVLPTGKRFAHTEQLPGSGGGGPNADGNDGTTGGVAAALSNAPIEVVENEIPALRIESYRLVPDSGGPGRFRGGLALERVFHTLIDNVQVNLRSGREATVPYGLRGGGSGAPAQVYIVRADASRVPVKGTSLFTMNAGDRFVYVTAGAGGYGPVSERPLDAVLKDLRAAKITQGHAASAYEVSAETLGRSLAPQ